MFSITRVCAVWLMLLGLATIATGRQVPKEVADKIDAVVAMAYQAASVKLPCKVPTQARYPMLRWQDVDKCLARAQNQVDWDAFVEKLKAVRPPYVPEGDFIAAVENSLVKQALPYDKVFLVRSKNAFLPLTNSILKYLPPNSLVDQPVYEQKGKQQVGTFLGVFFYEHVGGLSSANPYRLAQFQYKDLQGQSQVPLSGSLDRILYDSFGIPWNKIRTQPGLHLTHKKLQDFGIK